MIENSRPTEPGYYWWKLYPDAAWEIVRVHRTSGGHLLIGWFDQMGFKFLEKEVGIWGDKIDEPK